MTGKRPKACPRCDADIVLRDIHFRHCPHCGQGIQVSRAFLFKVKLAALPSILGVYVIYYFAPFASEPGFLLLFLWAMLMGVVGCGVWLLTAIIAYLVVPPMIEPDDGDTIRLHLE